MKLVYLKNKDIDKKKWDKTVEEASNGKIYGYSWYLDIVAENWNALITDDYKYIMPVPFYQKFKIKYSLTPYFVQHLSIFSQEEITEEVFYIFFDYLSDKFSYLNLSINIPDTYIFKNASILKRTNLILNIDRPYEEIYSGYKSDAKKKLKKNYVFQLKETDDIEMITSFYKKWNGHLVPYTEEHYQQLNRLMKKAKEKGHLISSELLDENNNIAAAGFFLVSHGRSYHVIAAQSKEGKEKFANHFFIDSFIKTYCQQIKIFDFEGSNIPGVATFFKKWGSVPEYYTRVEYAKFPMNIVKRFRKA
ncbi:MAG: hypothetical protein LUG18_03600 [Candidatus Azobacteroides sp.]|nr:hypothetical protein [Candidatus Azobacteroides sp.]